MILKELRIRVYPANPSTQGNFWPLWGSVFCFLMVFVLLFPTSPSWGQTVRNLYLQTDRDFQNLQKDPGKRQYRSHWEDVAKAFKDAYNQDPDDGWAPASLYRAAEVYLGLSQFSGRREDRDQAIALFQKVFHECPKSRYKFRASAKLKELNAPLAPPAPPPSAQVPLKTTRSTRPDTPTTVTTAPAATASAPPAATLPVPAPPPARVKAEGEDTSHLGKIQGVRYQTYPNRTRIVVDADRELAYSFNDLNRDRSTGLPPRVYVDFKLATLMEGLTPSIDVQDPQVKTLRIARNTADRVRLVMDLDQSRDFKVFQLFDPHRTVIDIWGTTSSSDKAELAASIPAAAPPVPAAVNGGAIRRQLALGVRRIVIDPGHGGKDPGAIGHVKGVFEKDINLQIAKILAEKLKKELQCDVILTRTGDTYLTLEERTQFANQHKADLFLSIHTNAAINRNAYGIETYFLNLATDEESIAVAARENATSTKNISDLQTILNDLMQNAKINESSRLASYVQKGMVDSVKPHYSHISDKGVKQAPFYVLLGAQMPSILIEAGFITNPRECQRLTNPQYQSRIADGIVEGIRRYIREHFPDNP
ncbi:N-acetylmuramoyl-L-alanine amidase [Desulfobotulus sp. H1]|uniref:N-acetylmuramoyl-L-alanine amidase n=1 Tax=Desulfobotulus pelophilus TaxID=2823377 RepID=A0ABT3NB63_9BACT|nr:N-acetylmuramoyl-L-alanine amidase [Desulfobotulus pelophilus]MCW7754706.1 N-acetylmuramoyl-L-alanine amidase [Desulfobotulus pelophilus]